MDPASILADVQLALTLGKMAIDFGESAGPFLMDAYNIAFNNKVLTPDERQAYRDKEAAYRARVDAVIADDDAAAGSTT